MFSLELFFFKRSNSSFMLALNPDPTTSSSLPVAFDSVFAGLSDSIMPPRLFMLLFCLLCF